MKFYESFETAIKVPFLPEWHNGTGYLDRMVREFDMRGGPFKTTDEWGRKILVMVHNGINNILFERYSFDPAAPNDIKDYHFKTGGQMRYVVMYKDVFKSLESKNFTTVEEAEQFMTERLLVDTIPDLPESVQDYIRELRIAKP